jgi:SulP family sulfate permease
MFPHTPIFSDFGGVGVSMVRLPARDGRNSLRHDEQFFVTCIVSQLVYSSRSIFKGGNGSMMIEVVVSSARKPSSPMTVSQPFLHSMVYQITYIVGEDQPRRVIATVMVAFALSAVLSGIVFFGLGLLRFV